MRKSNAISYLSSGQWFPGRDYFFRDGDSITATTAMLAMHPMLGSASVSMINAGLEGFVRAAALEMPRKLRIDAVSPPWVNETMVMFGMDPTPG